MEAGSIYRFIAMLLGLVLHDVILVQCCLTRINVTSIQTHPNLQLPYVWVPGPQIIGSL